MLLVGSTLSQYGGGGGGGGGAPVAPQPVVSSPSCWTEMETVWDTQYQDTTMMECQPVTQQVCNQVTKQVPQRVSRTVPKKVCDDGGSYGVQSSPVTQPREQANTLGQARPHDSPRLRTGASPDAVNFGRK